MFSRDYVGYDLSKENRKTSKKFKLHGKYDSRATKRLEQGRIAVKSMSMKVKSAKAMS